MRRWDAATGAPIGQPLTDHTDEVWGLAFSPDSTTLASASFDFTVRLWSAATGALIGRPLARHVGAVYGVAFSPDGRTIASASQDWSVELWDAANREPLDQRFTLPGPRNAVYGVAFSPDGKTIASANFDGTLRLWPITIGAWIEHACTLAKRNLTKEEWDEFVGPERPYARTCPDRPSGPGAPKNAPAATYNNLD